MLAATSGRPDEGRSSPSRSAGRPGTARRARTSSSTSAAIVVVRGIGSRGECIGQVHAVYPGLDQPGGHELIQPHRPEEAGPDGIGGVVLIASRAWLNVSFTWSRIVAGVCPSAWSTMYW